MMQLSRKNALIVLVGIIILLLIFVGITLYKIAGLLLAIAVPTGIGALLTIWFYISTQIWYKELTDKDFRLYRNAYQKYQEEVLEKKGDYNNAIEEYWHSIENFSVPTDDSGSIRLDILNKENVNRKRIYAILHNMRDVVEKYFRNDKFGYNEYLSLLDEYKKTNVYSGNYVNEYTSVNHDIVKEKLKEFVLSCYEQGGVMSLADRNFGYFIKHIHPEASTPTQYLFYWNKYIGKYEPRDNCRYITDPSYWKNESEISATIKSLIRIETFYSELIPQDSLIIKCIQRDMDSLRSVNRK